MEHSNVGRSAAPYCLTKLTSQKWIRLNGDDVIDLGRQRKCAAAQARADLDDQVTSLERGSVNEYFCDLRLEEVLSETTPSLVSWRPPDRGHGPSLRYPWVPFCSLIKGPSRSLNHVPGELPMAVEHPAPYRSRLRASYQAACPAVIPASGFIPCTYRGTLWTGVTCAGSPRALTRIFSFKRTAANPTFAPAKPRTAVRFRPPPLVVRPGDWL